MMDKMRNINLTEEKDRITWKLEKSSSLPLGACTDS